MNVKTLIAATYDATYANNLYSYKKKTMIAFLVTPVKVLSSLLIDRKALGWTLR